MLASVAAIAAPAAATLTVTPITWNIVGLDSNSPTSGPRYFPVGARVCSDVATTNVATNFVWDSANANVNLRAGSLSAINIASIGAGSCSDAYFEVDVTQVPAAYDTARRYHITATDGSGTASTPTPRELYVEHLVSQSRNTVSDVKYGPTLLSLTSVPAGGSLSLVVGNTYVIQLFGGTATQGYSQFEEFINFTNTKFQILSVSTSYSADDSPFVPNPNDKLYADACKWENDPNSPNYRGCVGGDFKAGGSNVVTTYTIKIIGGGGSSEALNTLLHDFSGSSFHYNADYGTGARIANIIDPTSATISKTFSPNPAPVNGVSALTFTLTNSNTGTVSGYNFVDNLPANLVVASTPGATTSGCGTPTLTATPGASSISFSNGTLAANSNCIIKVNVTPTATGSLVNTTNHLFIDAVDTTHNATATLTANTAPPPGTGLCGLTLAAWSVPNGTLANPPDLTGGLPTVKASDVGTATLVAALPASTSIVTSSGHTDTTSWGTYGYKAAGQYIEFTVDTHNYTAVQMGFWVANPSSANGPTQITVTVNSGGGFGAPVLTVNNPVIAFTFHSIDLTGLTSTTGNTVFRITSTGAKNEASGASLNYDDLAFTGCAIAIQPTITKAFAPNPIAVNGVSTLTFTLTNTNAAALTGAAFTDALPSGVQVAATPAAATTCGGTWTPASGATSLTFSGGTVPASGSCTVSVNVTATTSGPHGNVSGFLSTTEIGTTATSVASATLTAVLPPSIAKKFAHNPILANGVSTLTFAITNPNQNDALSGVAFADTFPIAPGAMVVAAAPNATTNGCGSPTFPPASGSGSISFSGGTIAAGGTCVVSVDVTAPSVGIYNNTSGSVSHVINSATVSGNTASDSLTVDPPNPSIGLLKQVSLNAAGPWSSFVALSTAPVYYQFTVENTGDVPLSPISLTDNTLDVSTCNATFAATTLPVAVAANNNHIVTCVVGPVPTTAGSHTNTAHATGTFGGTGQISPDSSATYATTGLTLAKSATETTYTLPGDILHYSYLVTNSGFAPLAAPVTVSDDKTTVTCPAVATVGDLDNFFDPGESVTCTATYTITGSDIANASVTNTANAIADGVTSNSASKSVPLSTSSDVSVSKTLTTGGPYLIGQSINYTLVVANGGPSTATSIQVTDTPTNLTSTSVSGSGCAALPCTIASLASGANTTILVTATINAAGAFDNSATATAAQPDPDTSNDTDNIGNGGTALPPPDLSLAKSDGGTSVAPGGAVAYTVTYSNTAVLGATGVVVTETVPANTTFNAGASTAGWICAPNNNAGSTCTLSIGSVAGGAGGSVTFAVTVTNPLPAGVTQISNTATVADDGTKGADPTPGNNSASDTTPVTGAPDLSLTKSDGGVSVAPGGTVGYTLTYANSGSRGATGVVVTETVPANTTLNAGASTAGWICAPDNNAGSTCTLSIGGLAAGAGGAVTFAVTVTNPLFAGVTQISNLATIGDDGANGTDPAPGDNAGSDTTPVTGAPDLSLTKSDGGASVAPGGTVAYTLTYSNTGNRGASGVILTETIPANATFNAGASTAGWSCAPDNNAGSTCTLTIGGLAAGAGGSATFAVTVTNPLPAGVTQVSNTATIADDATNGTDPTPGNNAASDTTPVTGAPDLSLTKSDGGTSVAPGGTVAYTLTYANTGNRGATGVVVTETVPANTTFNAGASTAGWACAPDNNAGSTCTTAIGGIAGGTGGSVTFAVTAVSPLASGVTISNTATIGDDGTNGADPTPASNTGSDTTPVTSAADLSLTKTVNNATPNVGAVVTFTITLTNAGPATATNITVADLLPPGLAFVSATPSAGGYDAVAGTWTLGTLGVGSETLDIVVTVIAAGAIQNTAEVTAVDQSDPDSTPNNHNAGEDDQANVSVAGQTADLAVTKVDSADPVHIGDSFSYTITVTNNGPSSAAGVVVLDTIPAEVTYNSSTASAGSCNFVAPTLTCNVGVLASGASATITVDVSAATSGLASNTATATTTTTDPNNANDSATETTTIDPVADLSLLKSVNNPLPNVGDLVTFTITLTNGGPSTATNITVEDLLPAGLTFVSATPSAGSYNNGTGAWTVPSLGPGSATLGIVATVTTPGTITNTAEVTATDQFDPDSTPNNGNAGEDDQGSASVGALQADLSLAKSVNNSKPNIGSSVTFTITLSNAGPSTATNIVVTDLLPAGLGFVSATPSIGGYVSGTGLWTVPSLGIGSATLQIVATVSVPGAITNSADVTSVDQTDPDSTPGNNNAGEDDHAAAVVTALQADVSVVKTLVTAGPYMHGQAISYTLVVANAGPDTATNVQITDTPTNLTITNVGGGGCAALPCTIASLGAGATATVNVTATIDAAGAFDNVATVTATEFDPNGGNNTDSTGNNGVAAAAADVSLVKTHTTAGPYVNGQSATYTLLVANNGPDTATNVQVTDTPTNLTITNVSGGGCAALPCTIASLASGANVTITVTAKINASGLFDNSATATATENDPNTGNNTDSTGNGGTAAASADVSLVKTLTTAGPYVNGQSVTYTLLVANNGPNTATSIQVTDTPANLTITNVSGGGCVTLPCTIASLASGANVTITVTATVNTAGAFDNTATVTAAEVDPNPGNNTDSTGNGGTASALADLSITKIDSADPVTVGDAFSYTVTVTNNGPSTATGVVMTDVIPASVTYVSSATTLATCSYAAPALTCSVGTLTSGASAVVTIDVTAAAAGLTTNTATVRRRT